MIAPQKVFLGGRRKHHFQSLCLVLPKTAATAFQIITFTGKNSIQDQFGSMKNCTGKKIRSLQHFTLKLVTLVPFSKRDSFFFSDRAPIWWFSVTWFFRCLLSKKEFLENLKVFATASRAAISTIAFYCEKLTENCNFPIYVEIVNWQCHQKLQKLIVIVNVHARTAKPNNLKLRRKISSTI